MRNTLIKIPEDHVIYMEEMIRHYYEPLYLETEDYFGTKTAHLQVEIDGVPARTEVSYFELMMGILPKAIFKGRNGQNQMLEYFRLYAIELSTQASETRAIAYLYDTFINNVKGGHTNTIALD